MPLRPAEKWLLALADPQDPAAAMPRPMGTAGLAQLLHLAGRHGVLPAVVAALDTLPPAGVLALGERQAADALAGQLQSAREEVVRLTAAGMLLARQGAGVVAGLAAGGIASIILKGSQFAARLYQPPGLRPFRDVDVLVSPADADAAALWLQQDGWQLASHDLKYAGGYGQSSFTRPGGGNLELHWNLVNSPTLRRAVSVELADLALRQVDDGPPEPTPAAMLLIAAVHAATSHGFDRLVLLCDTAQIVRGAAGELDAQWLGEALSRCGAGAALATALRLTAACLKEPACLALARELRIGEHLAARLLMTPTTVLRSTGGWGSLLRQGYRQTLK